MTFSFNDNIQHFKKGSRVYIYGSGSFGNSFYYSVRAHRADIKVLGFIDSTKTGEIHEKPIICINNFNQEKIEYDYIIICTDQIYWKEITSELEKNKIAKYFVNIYWDFDVFGKKSLDKYKEYEKYINHVRSIFSNERDILIWNALVSSMKFQNIKDLLVFGRSEQNKVDYSNYFELQKGDVVINGGASFGDESIFFADQVGSKGEVYAFDPNTNNNPTRKCIKNIPMVLWNKSENVNFRIDGSRSMILKDSNSGVKIIAITIDDFSVKNSFKRLDLIKLDVEGSELEVLDGAINTIRKFRPVLAISIYHKFEHFFEVPLLISRLVKNYTFHIDCINSYAIDTVFFAIPNERFNSYAD
jgi:FkbM family methyltransferase